MMEMIEANWPLLLVAFVIGLAIAWFLFNANRRTKVMGERSDVLDEGAAPAARNQALIDSAPAAGTTVPSEPTTANRPADAPEQARPVVPPATPMGLAGAGAAVSAGVEEAQDRRAEERVEAPAPAPSSTPAPDMTSNAPPPPPPIQAAAATAPAPSTASVAADGVDDLTRIKGIGPKLATALRELGITSFAEIANWDESDIDRVDARLGRFQGRIRRDDWVTQAQLLAGGDTAEYEARFGRLD